MAAFGWLDILADIAAICAAIAVLVTTVFVWRQVALQAAGHEKDERRFLRESIHTIHDTLQAKHFREARSLFFAGPHKSEFADLESKDKGSARYILSIYGLLARMVKHGAVDEAILRDYWESALLRDWDRLENFVSGERLRSKNHGLYVGTEKMAARWRQSDE